MVGGTRFLFIMIAEEQHSTHLPFAKLKRTTNFGFVMLKPGTKEAKFTK